MNYYLRLLLFLFFIISSLGCSQSDVLVKMESIKNIGEDNPKLALAMLDSLYVSIKKESQYVQMKYDLLNIRLSDKAYIKPISDLKITPLIKYFEEEGNDIEKQEVYYYAGSVYRDLQDTPRSLEYFHKSEEIAEENKECDSIMLRNTYSNLNCLTMSVQDYMKANYYAKKEFETACNIKKITMNSIMHLGVSYNCLDSIDEAKKFFKLAYNILSTKGPIKDSETVYNLLYHYSILRDVNQADNCYFLTKKLEKGNAYKPKFLNLGAYFEMTNNLDSAIICYKQVISDNWDVFNVYDASRNLFNIYYKDYGDYVNAAYYANIFVNACDTLDLGKRQELAATINNQYQYHLDKSKEMKLRKEQEKQRTWLVAVSAGALIVIALLSLVMLFRKNRHLREMVRLSNLAEKYKSNSYKLQQAIDDKIVEIKKKEDELTQVTTKLKLRSKELIQVQIELKSKEEELENSKSNLMERIEQNKSLFSLIHKAKLEKDSKDIVDAVRKSALGVKNMTSSQWEQLYAAIDELYPDFKQLMTDKLGRFTEQQMQVCYLLKIGLSNTKIMNMTGVPKTTLWRWLRKYDWIITSNNTMNN